MRVRREVLGDEHVDRATAAAGHRRRLPALAHRDGVGRAVDPRRPARPAHPLVRHDRRAHRAARRATSWPAHPGRPAQRPDARGDRRGDHAHRRLRRHPRRQPAIGAWPTASWPTARPPRVEWRRRRRCRSAAAIAMSLAAPIRRRRPADPCAARAGARLRAAGEPRRADVRRPGRRGSTSRALRRRRDPDEVDDALVAMVSSTDPEGYAACCDGDRRRRTCAARPAGGSPRPGRVGRIARWRGWTRRRRSSTASSIASLIPGAAVEIVEAAHLASWELPGRINARRSPTTSWGDHDGPTNRFDRPDERAAGRDGACGDEHVDRRGPAADAVDSRLRQC